jgi:tetratricopeptide (TPR) repeat protein
MKRILIALAVLISVQIADAQVKSPADAKKAVESAAEATANPKKAVKPATWIKLGNAYMDAYNAPAGQGWVGATMQELQLITGTDKPSSTENVNLLGTQYTKQVYETRNYYFSPDGKLAFVEVTKPVYDDALAQALDAYKKAYEVDAKGQKTKDIVAGLQNINQAYQVDAYTQYQLGNYEAASQKFEAAADAAATEPNDKIDSLAIYNAGFTAELYGDYERVAKFLKKALDISYYTDGETYAKLANACLNLKDTLTAKTVYEEGFTKFPESQSILIGLINYYIQSGDNPEQLFVLLDKAKANEPDNASLYYVEGDIYNKLGDKEKAVEAYRKSTEINPEYEFGYIGIGILYYNEAIEIQDLAAREMDDAKYMALIEEFETALKNAIEPFESAFAVTKDKEIKVNIAEYLKNIYYRFRDENPQYMEAYNKYDTIVKNGVSAL